MNYRSTTHALTKFPCLQALHPFVFTPLCVFGSQVRIVSERDEAAVMAAMFASDQLEERFAGGGSAYLFDPDAYLAATYPDHLNLGRPQAAARAHEATAEANAAPGQETLVPVDDGRLRLEPAAPPPPETPPLAPATVGGIVEQPSSIYADFGADAAASSALGSGPGQLESCPGEVDETEQHYGYFQGDGESPQ
jgi:hypothetical protein